MNFSLWIICLGIGIVLLVGTLLFLWNSVRQNSRRDAIFRVEENCKIELSAEAKLEFGYYEETGRRITFEVTWADMKSGRRIYMDGFGLDSETKISLEENSIVAARLLKYFGFVRNSKILKLNYGGTTYPSADLIEQIELKIKPLGFARVKSDADNEITWEKG